MVFDIIVLVIILASALISFLRGIIRETLTILGVVGGLAAAYYFGPHLIPVMDSWLGVKEGVPPEKLLGIVGYDKVAIGLAYGAVFIVVVVLLSIISHILAETARSIGLGPVDRTLGVIFGIARAILLISIVYLVASLITGAPLKNADFFKDSKTVFFIDYASQEMEKSIPQEMLTKLKKDTETLKQGSEAQQKLQQMDVLKGQQRPQEQGQPQPGQNTQGYTDDFRNQMDKLFENKPPSAPPSAQPAPAQEPSAQQAPQQSPQQQQGQ